MLHVNVQDFKTGIVFFREYLIYSIGTWFEVTNSLNFLARVSNFNKVKTIGREEEKVCVPKFQNILF